MTDNVWFTLLTMNTNPIHFDSTLSKSSPFGKPLVNSCLTLSLVTGMSVIDLSQFASLASIAYDAQRRAAIVADVRALENLPDVPMLTARLGA